MNSRRARSLAQSIKKEQQKSDAQLKEQIEKYSRHYYEVWAGRHRTQRTKILAATKATRNNQDQAAEHHRRLGCAERPDR